MASGKGRKGGGGRSGQRDVRGVHALNTHADFQCRSSGVCCATAWPLPIDDPRAEAVLRWVEGGDLAVRADDLFTGDPGGRQFAKTEQGACVFLNEDTRCDIHAHRGAEALPDTCRLFPRFAVLQPRRTSLSLSHFCPTALDHLFRAQEPAARVRNPSAFPKEFEYAGLDARTHAAPLLKSGVLMTWDGYTTWEDFVLSTLAVEGVGAGAAMLHLLNATTHLRPWKGGGPMPARMIERRLRALGAPDASRLGSLLSETPRGLRQAPGLFLSVASQRTNVDDVAAPWVRGCLERYGQRGDRFEADFDRYGAPLIAECDAIVRRYLGTRLFANHFGYLGAGLRAGLMVGVFALTSLRVLTTLFAAQGGRMALPGDLKEAVRLTDWLLLHGAAHQRLQASFDVGEQVDLSALIELLPG